MFQVAAKVQMDHHWMHDLQTDVMPITFFKYDAGAERASMSLLPLPAKKFDDDNDCSC